MAGSFRLDLARFQRKATVNMSQVVRKVCFDILGSVVVGRPVGNGTPVDTGRARGGWIVAIDTIPYYEPIAVDKGGGATISAADQAIFQAPGHILYIVNNVPYIRYLEYGPEIGAHGSPQAPGGMVRPALRSYPGIVENGVRSVGR